jgi:hypothetical protein
MFSNRPKTPFAQILSRKRPEKNMKSIEKELDKKERITI